MKLGNWMCVAMACGLAVLAGCSGKKQDSPKGTMDTFAKASQAKDVDAMASCMAPDYRDAYKKMTVSAMQLTAKDDAVRATVESKLGKDVADKLFGRKMADGPMSFNGAMENGKFNWDKVKINENGDKATVEVDGKPSKWGSLAKFDGKWCIVPEQSADQMSKQADKAKDMFDKMTKAYDDFAKKVNDGSVTKDNAQAELGKCMGAAMGHGGGPN